jgi:hypothetical protein
MTEDFSVFGSVTSQIHQELVHYYYLFLPVFFGIALVIDWFRNPLGSSDFLGTLKRAVIATLLLIGFEEISGGILDLANGLADKISDLSGIDSIMKMASEKASTYTMSSASVILGINDFVISLITFLSYVILCVARYVIVALYHFMWNSLVILSPILILFTLFRGTIGIPIGLFRSLAEVASYKVVWAILSAMLTSLSFGNAYAADGQYLTVIVINFIVALAMLMTPLVVKSLVGSGLSSMGQTLGAGAAMAMISVPARAAGLARVGGSAVSTLSSFSGAMGSGGGSFGFGTTQQPHPSPPPNLATSTPHSSPPSAPPLPPHLPPNRPKI